MPERHRVRSAVNVRPHGNYYRLLICGRSRASASAETSAQTHANGLRTFGRLLVSNNVPVCLYSPFAGISSETLAFESLQPVPTPVRLSRRSLTLANSRVWAGYGLPYQRYLLHISAALYLWCCPFRSLFSKKKTARNGWFLLFRGRFYQSPFICPSRFPQGLCIAPFCLAYIEYRNSYRCANLYHVAIR